MDERGTGLGTGTTEGYGRGGESGAPAVDDGARGAAGDSGVAVAAVTQSACACGSYSSVAECREPIRHRRQKPALFVSGSEFVSVRSEVDPGSSAGAVRSGADVVGRGGADPGRCDAVREQRIEDCSSQNLRGSGILFQQSLEILNLRTVTECPCRNFAVRPRSGWVSRPGPAQRRLCRLRSLRQCRKLRAELAAGAKPLPPTLFRQN